VYGVSYTRRQHRLLALWLEETKETKPLGVAQVPANCAQLQTLIADFTLHIADGVLQKLPVFNGADKPPPR
jgi:hypothetical protein